jgi:hypothetical protein
MLNNLIRTLRRLHTDESGQSLIIVAIGMVVVMAMAAFTIDVGSWYTQRHHDQVVADSAALAAANCLANPGAHSGLGPSCTTSTDTADAQTVAVDYAAANGVTITTSNVSVNTTNDTVNVTASTTSPSFFANLFGLHSNVESAGSQAKWSVGSSSTPCTSGAQSADTCYAIYTANSTCGSSNGYITSSINITVNGEVHSQGSLNISNGTFKFNGPITYSSGNCSYTAAQNGTEAGAYSPAAGGNEPSSYWPTDYTTIFTACGTSATYQCTGPGGTPSYCNYAATNYSWNYSGALSGVVCAYGNGTPSDPATWTGSITVSNGGSYGTASSPLSITMIAGSVSVSSSTQYLKPASNNCLIYAVDTDAAAGGTAVNLGNGNFSINGGTIFAPHGTIAFGSTAASAGFLEGLNVNTGNMSGTFTGAGPVPGASGASGTGSDYLSQ